MNIVSCLNILRKPAEFVLPIERIKLPRFRIHAEFRSTVMCKLSDEISCAFCARQAKFKLDA